MQKEIGTMRAKHDLSSVANKAKAGERYQAKSDQKRADERQRESCQEKGKVQTLVILFLIASSHLSTYIYLLLTVAMMMTHARRWSSAVRKRS